MGSLRDTMDTDLTTFFSTDEFAVEVTFADGTVDAIYDHEYVETMDVAGTRPVIMAATADVSDKALGAAVTIDGESYRVASNEADGTGVSRMELEAL